MISKKSVAIAATLGVALSGLALAPAQAEPVSNSYAIVGSDTLEDVVNALVNGTTITGSDVRSVIGGASLGSFDATGTPYIITKPSGVRFARPNGSSDGIKALSRSITGNGYTSTSTTASQLVQPNAVISGEVDIARSSSGPKAAGTTNGLNGSGDLAYIPFARDAIAYAYGAVASGDTVTTLAPNLPALTKEDLKTLYTCGGDTNATSVSLGGVRVLPVIPQAGSGTRSDFISKIGTTDSDVSAAVLKGCVVERQEHDASALATNELMPMSASRWVAMSNGASFKKQSAVATIAGVTTTLGTAVAAVDGSAGALEPNAAYYANSTWGRDTYLVVEYARIDSTNTLKYDVNLATILNPASSTKSLTWSSTSLASTTLAVKKKFGFLAPSSSTISRADKTP